MAWFNDPVLKILQSNAEHLSLTERKVLGRKLRRLRTAAALSIAVLIGALIAAFHGGNVSTSIAALGAALGLGGVIGFLFGVPSSARTPINIKADTATVSTGDQSPTKGGDAKIGSADQSAESSSVDATVDSSSGVATSSSVAPATNGLASATDAASAGTTVDAAKSTPDDGGNTLPDHPSNLEQVADWVTKLLLGGGLTQMQRIPPKIWEWSRLVAIGILKERNPDPTLVMAQQAFAAGLLVYGFILGFFAGFLITKLQLGKEVWQ
jgi:hypothetical protein